MADIGYIALLLAMVASIYSGIAYIFGVRGRYPALVNSARTGLFVTFGLVTFSTLILLLALLTHNFQIEYVASYTSRDMPFVYLVSSLWAGNKGSLLFWAWLLSLFAMLVVLPKREKKGELVPYASSIIILTEAFFLILLVSVSNPFFELNFMPVEGRGLNPMLENPGMIFHPPILLAGYVGFTIPFAFAIGALLSRRLGEDWIRPARSWALLSWLLLGVGNIIGAWWAYVELGWGGYWSWDPVENAGLMPWLVATAFLHSIMMQRRRGIFKIWNIGLIILTFNLAIFGTFLTRSGILSSVHTFSESSLSPFFIAFLGITFIGSLVLLYYRKERLKSDAQVENLLSREGTFWINNLLLVGATLVIFIGTVFPAISEALYGVKIEVGESFFNQVNGPIFLAIILLAGICAFIGWQKVSIKNLVRKFLWPFSGAIVIGAILLIAGMRQWYAIVAFSLCGFVLFSILYEWFRETKARRQSKAENYLKAWWRLISGNRARYGGYIVHISIILIAIGVIGSSFYDVEKEIVLKPGEATSINNYTLTYDNLDYYETPSKEVVTATLSLYNGERFLGKLTPEKYFHRSYEQPVTEVAIHTNLIEDVYVILAGWDDSGAATFMILVNPLVIWIWIGGGLLAAGGLLTFWPGQRKSPITKQVTKLPGGDKLEDEIEKQVLQLRREKGSLCPKCGARKEKNARFCSHCGVRFNQE